MAQRGCYIRRVSVGAGLTVAISPPAGVDQVDIGNAGTGDLQVLSEDPATYLAGDNYVVVSPGYDRVIGAPRSDHALAPFRFAADTPLLWVRYANPSDTGTVVLTWL